MAAYDSVWFGQRCVAAHHWIHWFHSVGGRRNADGLSSIFEAHVKMTAPSSGISRSTGATDRACVWSEGRQPFARVERYLADVAASYLITWRGSELSLIIRPNYQAGVDRWPMKRQTAFIQSLRVRLLELSYLLHQESWKTLSLSLHPPIRNRHSHFIPAFACTFNYCTNSAQYWHS